MKEQIQELSKLKEERLLRLKQVLEFIPVSKSTWWAGCASGKFPAPIKLTERTTVWKMSDISNLIASLGV